MPSDAAASGPWAMASSQPLPSRNRTRQTRTTMTGSGILFQSAPATLPSSQERTDWVARGSPL